MELAQQELRSWRQELRLGAKGELGESAYKDVSTCPVCVQVLTKPAELFTDRELKHIFHHTQVPLIEDVILHCIHRIHGFAWCCMCMQYSPNRLNIELSSNGFVRSSREIQIHQKVITH